MRVRLLLALAFLPLAACVQSEGDPSYRTPGVTFGGAPAGYYGERSVVERSFGGFGAFGSGGYSNVDDRRNRRTFRPDKRVVCDRATEVCYKRGRIDKSETEDAFGNRAGDRADDIRDRYGRSDVYVDRRGRVYDRDRDSRRGRGRYDGRDNFSDRRWRRD